VRRRPFCRQSFYTIAAALDVGGPAALVPGKPGPKGPTKLTEPVREHLEILLRAFQDLKGPAPAAAAAEEFDLTAHPRSIAVNRMWKGDALLACDLSAWLQLLAPIGTARRRIATVRRLQITAPPG